MRIGKVSRSLLGLAVVLTLAPAVMAADRHVLLDTDGDGQLNDCPNPAHNAQGTSNTAELQRCNGGTQTGRIIGIAGGRISASACMGGNGTVVPLTTGSSADIDGDGALEPIYGHPQACVYNMARSDSCEVHSGVYRRPGAFCDEDCGFGSLGGALDNCDRYDCWQATVVAFGMGPNLTGTGYGTSSQPGLLRGARMSGSTDTWDVDGDRVPDSWAGETPGYPVVFSGDVNGNGVFDTTTCTGNACSGDAFYGVIVGCGGGGGYGSSFCTPSRGDGSTWVRLDRDGDGTTETNYGTQSYNSAETHHLVVEDIEFSGYNGGSGAAPADGARLREGMLALEGNDGSTDGLKLGHIYMHSNDYGLNPSAETFWSLISDSHNGNCVDETEIHNSTFVQTTEKLLDDDCGGTTSCGCPKNFHDNKVLVDITSPRARGLVVPFYFKAIDKATSANIPKRQRIWNNEFIIKDAGGAGGYFMDLQAFGNNQGTGLGELWVYGNIFRNYPGTSGTARLKRFWNGSCGVDTLAWKAFMFNNTFDMTFNSSADGIWRVCSGGDGPGTLLVEANNAYYGATGVHASLVPDHVLEARRVAEICSTTQPGCTAASGAFGTWFAGSPNLDATAPFANYLPATVSPLRETGTCDPDRDGLAGVDYDGNGSRDTEWTDIGGNLVSCPSVSTPLHVGALQADIGALGTPPATPSVSVSGVDVFTATIAGSAFSDVDAGDTHAASQFQAAPQVSGFTGPNLRDSGVLSGAIRQWSPTGLLAGTLHQARLRYRDANGLWSAWSSPASFTTLVDTVPPNAVQNLRRADTP